MKQVLVCDIYYNTQKIVYSKGTRILDLPKSPILIPTPNKNIVASSFPCHQTSFQNIYGNLEILSYNSQNKCYDVITPLGPNFL